MQSGENRGGNAIPWQPKPGRKILSPFFLAELSTTSLQKVMRKPEQNNVSRDLAINSYLGKVVSLSLL